MGIARRHRPQPGRNDGIWRTALATITVYARGDQIGTYGDAARAGNNDQLVLTLDDVQAIGAADQIYRIVITQVNRGQTTFQNGQWVSIYTWSEDNPEGTLVYSWLNPQDDLYQGRASGSQYQVYSHSANLVIDARGVTEGTMTYGPEQNEPRNTKMPFDALASTPEQLVICFAAGTRILTPTGLRLIETLRPGDAVWTRDNGFQPLRWIGRRRVCALGDLAPVRIAPGALGNDRAVLLSPQHRVLITGWRAELYFGQDEVLVAARHLVDGSDVQIMPRANIDYLHLAFDSHEILCAEGLMAESLFLGPMALSALPRAARDEITTIFPELADLGLETGPQTSLPCVSRREAAVLGVSRRAADVPGQSRTPGAVADGSGRAVAVLAH